MALGLVDSAVSEIPTNHSSAENIQQQTKITSDVHSHGNSNDLVASYVMKFFGSFIAAQCQASYSLQPLYYHIGCAFFLLAFIAPSYRLGSALFIRLMLTFGSILFLMWSYLVECRPDVLVWTILFIFVNLVHMAILICKLRPVKFEREIEEVSIIMIYTFTRDSIIYAVSSFEFHEPALMIMQIHFHRVHGPCHVIWHGRK
jgi:Popeye protein conserved region